MLGARGESTLALESFYGDLLPLLKRVDEEAHERALDLIMRTYEADGTVFAAGNGGSASSASHLICDFTKSARPASGRALRGIVLTDQAAFSAYANDVAYSQVFSEQLSGLGRRGDCLVVISASGRSANIVKALETARSLGISTIGLLGCDGGPAADLCDVPVVTPNWDAGIVETVHMAVLHSLTVLLRQRLQRATVLAT